MSDRDRLAALIEQLKIPHDVNDKDNWYTCPLALDEDGESRSANEAAVAAEKCTCGAEAHNAKVDAVVRIVREMP